MELAHYIKNLLYNHDVVVIPTLGGLITKYKPAEINSSENSIIPPSKFVLFDSTLIISDGLLARHIAEQKRINIKEAEEYINQEVKSLTRKLDSGETIIFDGIGYLSKENGIIRFEREDINFFTGSFGLSKVEYKAAEHKPAPPIITNRDHFEREEKRNLLPVYIFLFAFVIIVGAILVYLFYPGKVSRFLKIPQSVEVEQNQSADTLNKDSIRANDLEIFFDNATDKKKALAIDKANPNSTNIHFDGRYYIIAGSFVDFERASKYAKQLGKEGYKSEVIQFNQETFRVIIGEYKDKNQAIDELLKIRAVKGEDAAWLFSK